MTPQSYRITGPSGYRSRLTVGRPVGNISKRSGKIPAFILDLDQTIWDTTDEAKIIEQDLISNVKSAKGRLVAKDWDEWTRAASKVSPIPEMVDFAKGLQNSGIQPVIMTSRDMANEGMIRSTLKDYGINADYLMMRGMDNAEQALPSDVLKTGMMERLKNQFNFLTIIDDSEANIRSAYKFRCTSCYTAR